MSDIDTTNTQGKLPGSKAELKAKGPEINHKNVNTVGHETVTGKAGDDAKRNVKRKGGGGGAGRKPARGQNEAYARAEWRTRVGPRDRRIAARACLRFIV